LQGFWLAKSTNVTFSINTLVSTKRQGQPLLGGLADLDLGGTTMTIYGVSSAMPVTSIHKNG
jgi:hypothetical protein